MRDVFNIAILAYRNGNYQDALNLMLQVTDADPSDWLAKQYLGMIYTQLGQISNAHRLFKRIVNECPDVIIRERAEGSLLVVEANLQAKFSKEALKPAPSQAVRKIKPKSTFDDEISWVG
jgi:tetratricopeptide (TPR) repeat protein